MKICSYKSLAFYPVAFALPEYEVLECPSCGRRFSPEYTDLGIIRCVYCGHEDDMVEGQRLAVIEPPSDKR
jgi:hypothetical protein